MLTGLMQIISTSVSQHVARKCDLEFLVHFERLYTKMGNNCFSEKQTKLLGLKTEQTLCTFLVTRQETYQRNGRKRYSLAYPPICADKKGFDKNSDNSPHFIEAVFI